MAEGRVVREENGETYEAPSESEWQRGFRKKVDTSPGGSGYRPGSTAAAGSADLSDDEIDKMPEGLGKTLARNKRARAKASSPQMDSLKSMAK